MKPVIILSVVLSVVAAVIVVPLGFGFVSDYIERQSHFQKGLDIMNRGSPQNPPDGVQGEVIVQRDLAYQELELFKTGHAKNPENECAWIKRKINFWDTQKLSEFSEEEIKIILNLAEDYRQVKKGYGC